MGERPPWNTDVAAHRRRGGQTGQASGCTLTSEHGQQQESDARGPGPPTADGQGSQPARTRYLNDIEYNRRTPSEVVLRQICDVLELDVDEMLSAAGRLGEDAEHYLKRNPTAGVLFRRVSQGGLREQELKELITEVDRLERKRPQEPSG